MVEPPRTTNRAYLDVPIAEKDTAKALGARWDTTTKRWYDPNLPTPGLDRWAQRPDLPDVLPGEDRTFGSGLFVDMIPKTCWFTNVRTSVTPGDWERLRRMIVGRAGQRCEACGAREDRTTGRWLEAHERWAYDDTSGTQTLRRLICLCTPCHQATHLGHANVTGRGPDARRHLSAVTGMTPTEVEAQIHAAGQLWIKLSQQNWRLDLRILITAGITVTPPQAPDARARKATRALSEVRATQPSTA